MLNIDTGHRFGPPLGSGCDTPQTLTHIVYCCATVNLDYGSVSARCARSVRRVRINRWRDGVYRNKHEFPAAMDVAAPKLHIDMAVDRDDSCSAPQGRQLAVP
jgi:hypothetical protein